LAVSEDARDGPGCRPASAPTVRYQTGAGICNFFGVVSSFRGSGFAGPHSRPLPPAQTRVPFPAGRRDGTKKLLTPRKKMQNSRVVWYRPARGLLRGRSRARDRRDRWRGWPPKAASMRRALAGTRVDADRLCHTYYAWVIQVHQVHIFARDRFAHLSWCATQHHDYCHTADGRQQYARELTAYGEDALLLTSAYDW